MEKPSKQSAPTESPNPDAARLLSKAIGQLGEKWKFRQEGKKLIEDSCLSINPGWYDDLMALQGFLIALVCLLSGPIIFGYGCVFANYNFSYNGAMRAILDKEMCVVSTSQHWQMLAHPVHNCDSICRGMQGIPRPENLTPEEFLSQYAYSGRPVLIRDATSQWTALNSFSFQYFKRLFQPHAERWLEWDTAPSKEEAQRLVPNTEDAADLDACQFFPYRTTFQNLAEFFNISEARSELDPSEESYYVGWNNCFREVIDELRHHYSRPAFLPSESESSRVDWIFMGGSTAKMGGGAPVHIDHVGRPSWQAVVAGYKTWTLYPPPECESVCPSEVVVDMDKGDVLVVDTNMWYHGTKAQQGVVTISIGSEYD